MKKERETYVKMRKEEKEEEQRKIEISSNATVVFFTIFFLQTEDLGGDDTRGYRHEVCYLFLPFHFKNAW